MVCTVGFLANDVHDKSGSVFYVRGCAALHMRPLIAPRTAEALTLTLFFKNLRIISLWPDHVDAPHSAFSSLIKQPSSVSQCRESAAFLELSRF